MKTCFRFLSLLTSLLASAAAVALIVIIPLKLIERNTRDFISSPSENTLRRVLTCLLSKDPTSMRECIYGISIGGIAILVILVVSILTCVTCNCCGVGGAFEAFAKVGLTVWFAIGASVLVPRAMQANEAGIEERNARVLVMTAVIGGAVANGLGVLVEIGRLLA